MEQSQIGVLRFTVATSKIIIDNCRTVCLNVKCKRILFQILYKKIIFVAK
jgi:hypothetical protein